MIKIKGKPKNRIRKLIAKNPKVDAQQLFEVIKLLDALEKQGIFESKYNLSSPFSSNKTLCSSKNSH